jgi:hypothetical protein
MIGGCIDLCFRDAEDVESEIRVGFVTYSNTLHFYNIKVLIIVVYQLLFILSVTVTSICSDVNVSFYFHQPLDVVCDVHCIFNFCCLGVLQSLMEDNC